jgi:FkbM family methyltransferase
MYSQDDEEKFILECFGEEKGYFLDIGAAGGIRFSNTRALVERGWRGIMVEPSPKQFLELFEVYKDNPEIVLLNAALACSASPEKFYFSPETVVNTINREVKEEWSRSFKYWSWFIFTMPVTLFVGTMVKFNVDFVSIDAEGESWAIAIELMNLGCRPKMFVVEHDHLQERGEAVFGSRGYKKIHTTGNNTIWTR